MPANESALDPMVHRLYWMYQTSIHGDPDPFRDNDDAKFDGDEWGRLAPPGWREQAYTMLTNEYASLEKHRQERIRRSFASFYEFLVENPFVAVVQEQQQHRQEQRGHAVKRLGTYHQHYRLSNGLLIAVGVVDILPTGLSSVYLYYDPSFAQELIPLGKYATLREIEWTQQCDLPNYYLGYYIESCQKMRYKAEYHPSELLCPTTYQWVDAEKAIATLQKESPIKHCCTLSESAPEQRQEEERARLDAVVSCAAQIPMDIGHANPITLDMLTPSGQAFMRPLLTEFVAQAGPAIARQCTINLRQS